LPKSWFIIHTYSGFEKKVAESLLQRAKAHGVEDQIGRIEIPTEEVVEMKAGKKVQTATRFFPGYLLVELETEESPEGRKIPDTTWHFVRNTPKVTGFVGSGQKPVPLSDEEADQIFNQVMSPSRRAEVQPTRARRCASRSLQPWCSRDVNLDRT
jgi:transcriptional antiterminator NusG